MTLNSNFDCPCQTDVDSEEFKKKYVLNLAKFNKNDDPKNTDGPDVKVDHIMQGAKRCTDLRDKQEQNIRQTCQHNNNKGPSI